MGIGAIPDAALAALTQHKNLGIHTEMFSDGVLPLIECNAITNSEKYHFPVNLLSLLETPSFIFQSMEKIYITVIYHSQRKWRLFTVQTRYLYVVICVVAYSLAQKMSHTPPSPLPFR